VVWFACGDVVPGCRARFVGEHDEDILSQVAVHAAGVHGISEVPAELAGAVTAATRAA
jgi:predicted small metal-binding protein